MGEFGGGKAREEQCERMEELGIFLRRLPAMGINEVLGAVKRSESGRTAGMRRRGSGNRSYFDR